MVITCMLRTILLTSLAMLGFRKYTLTPRMINGNSSWGGGRGRLLNWKRVNKKFQWVSLLNKIITILVGGILEETTLTLFAYESFMFRNLIICGIFTSVAEEMQQNCPKKDANTLVATNSCTNSRYHGKKVEREHKQCRYLF